MSNYTTNDLTTTVNQYIKNGWCPIPIPAGQKQPPPLKSTGKDPALTLEQIAELWEGRENSNVALRMQPCGDWEVISLDVDHYDKKKGADTLEALERDLGDLPETVRSTRRGVDNPSGQRFYRVPAGFKWKSDLGNGIEIVQMTHRYSVVWPSEVDGDQYTWYLGDEKIDIPSVDDLPELPERWTNFLKKGSAVLRDRSEVQALDLAKAMEWLEDYAPETDAEISTYFQKRLDSLDWQARARHDVMNDAVSEFVKAAVMDGHAGIGAALQALYGAFIEALDGDRLEKAAKEFEKSLTGAVVLVSDDLEAGARSFADITDGIDWTELNESLKGLGLSRIDESAIAHEFGVPVKKAKETGSWRDRAMSGAWLDDQEFPELQWTVPGLIPEGYGVIVAPPKAGKSWLVANVGLAAAGGGKALGSICVDQRPVLYMALEDGPRRLQDRYRKLTGGAPIPEALESITEASRDEALAWIEEFATEFAEQRPLIILDTLGKIMGHKSSNQSAYAHDYEEGSRLKRIAAVMPGGTLLVVHHTNKGQHDDFQDAVSGTQGIAGAADFTMHLARKRKSPQGFLSITGRDVTENEYAVTFQNNGLWTLDGGTLDAAAEAVEEARAEDKQNNLPTAQGQSLQILREAGDEGMTATEFAQKAGISLNTACKRLNRMAEEDVIFKTEDKRYKAPEIPRSVPLVRHAPDTGSA